MATTDDVERRIGAFLIGNIDDDGYLRGELDEAMTAAQTDRSTVERVLALIQTFDPAGVGARDLCECLLIQIRLLGLEGSLLETIVLEYLPKIEARSTVHLTDVAKELTKTLHLSPDELAMALRLLKQLDPKPGSEFSSEPAEAIVPDVIVLKVGQDYQIFLNDEGIPRLRISATYRRMLREGQLTEPNAKHYLEDKLRSAVWLIRSIEQRRQTLYKVANSLVKFQRDFFDHGLAHLKPLVLKDVAEDIGMHESTVSRVTSNKYVSTPRGLFEMKYFFTTALASSTGAADHSAEAVRHRIRQLIDAEPAAEILSDDTIAEMLQKEQGIEVARRTVAKYREAMNIPSSVIRRRQKRALVAAR